MGKVIELNVGEMRAQCAYKSADTTDAQGNWTGTFKIEIESI